MKKPDASPTKKPSVATTAPATTYTFPVYNEDDRVRSPSGDWTGTRHIQIRTGPPDLGDFNKVDTTSFLLKNHIRGMVAWQRQGILLPFIYRDDSDTDPFYRAVVPFSHRQNVLLMDKNFGPPPDRLWGAAEKPVCLFDSDRADDVRLIVAPMRYPLPSERSSHQLMYQLLSERRTPEAMAVAIFSSLNELTEEEAEEAKNFLKPFIEWTDDVSQEFKVLAKQVAGFLRGETRLEDVRRASELCVSSYWLHKVEHD